MTRINCAHSTVQWTQQYVNNYHCFLDCISESIQVQNLSKKMPNTKRVTTGRTAWHKLFIIVLLNIDTALTLHLARQIEIFSCAPTFSVLLSLKEKDIQPCPKSILKTVIFQRLEQRQENTVNLVTDFCEAAISIHRNVKQKDVHILPCICTASLALSKDTHSFYLSLHLVINCQILGSGRSLHST